LKRFLLLAAALAVAAGCSKVPPVDDTPSGETPAAPLPKAIVVSAKVDGNNVKEKGTIEKVSLNPVIRLEFTREVKADEASLKSVDFSGPELSVSADPSDVTVLVFKPKEALASGTRYKFTILSGECFGVNLKSEFTFWLTTAAEFEDKTDKFSRISDDELLTLVQKQTFKYFWDYAHPTSGLARERYGSGDTVTSGGSGFGIMAIPVGIERGFITRDEGAERMRKIIGFLSSAQTFHGAYPHWLNGSTGKVIPFSDKDNGGDLVETAFLIEGLLTAQAYFDRDSEADIRSGIDAIWRGVEWDWYTQGGQKVLYWHWSPDKGWAMNMQIRGWNEALIVYVLAASSPTHTISADVFRQGWGTFTFPVAGNQPLFFAHYSFLGLDPRRLSDSNGSYWEQNVAQARYNYNYCVRNPQGHSGYSASSWGLTASDYPGGYIASSPSNDRGTIAPTAALASMPYLPDESMAALRYFYYKLGDRLWGTYGFKDAFCLDNAWFASSYIAIDQGPIIAMIENHRTALLWNLFMKNKDVRGGLTKLEIVYE
jgi:hypothetical protein